MLWLEKMLIKKKSNACPFSQIKMLIPGKKELSYHAETVCGS